MAEIKLKCGAIALVDDADYESLNKFTWYLDKWGYVMRKTTINGRKGKTLGMGRVVMNAGPGQIVDHIDRNPLNNQSANLRFADASESSMNKGKMPGRSSQFKGVTWNKRSKLWVAKIGFQKKYFYLGRFKCEHEAGHAYNRAAVTYFGEFAVLNPVGQ